MILIHRNFIGGNISVSSIDGDNVYLENELRDTTQDWFYWAFCAEGAAGSTITFHMQKTRIGHWGPAVSHDLKNWHWLGSFDGDSFTYRFAEDENKVYFAHHMLYHPERFFDFCSKNNISVSELCRSKRGRAVPFITIGEGKKSIIMTARHHACESPGNYVLEGVLTELLSSPIPDSRIFCVPFTDLDGVLDGDQGKARAPYDHNRDYTDTPSIYPEVAAIRQYADTYGCNYGFDFHAPYHKGGKSDLIYIVRNSTEKLSKIERFSSILEKEITEGSMKYKSTNDYPPMTGWNQQPSPNFGFTMMHRPECEIAFTLESTYFGTPDNQTTPEKLIELGRCYAGSIKKYINTVEN